MARRQGVSQNFAERTPFAAAAEAERPKGSRRAQAIEFLLAMDDADERDKIAAMTRAGPAARQQR
jgi:hypothetical protein